MVDRVLEDDVAFLFGEHVSPRSKGRPASIRVASCRVKTISILRFDRFSLEENDPFSLRLGSWLRRRFSRSCALSFARRRLGLPRRRWSGNSRPGAAGRWRRWSRRASTRPVDSWPRAVEGYVVESRHKLRWIAKSNSENRENLVAMPKHRDVRSVACGRLRDLRLHALRRTTSCRIRLRCISALLRSWCRLRRCCGGRPGAA